MSRLTDKTLKRWLRGVDGWEHVRAKATRVTRKGVGVGTRQGDDADAVVRVDDEPCVQVLCGGI